MEDLSKLKVPELKAELTSRQLPTNGLKAELVARLQEAIDGGSTSAGQEPNGDGGEQDDAFITPEAEAVAVEAPSERVEEEQKADDGEADDFVDAEAQEPARMEEEKEEEMSAVQLLRASQDPPASTPSLAARLDTSPDAATTKAAPEEKTAIVVPSTTEDAQSPPPRNAASPSRPTQPSITPAWLATQLAALDSATTSSSSSAQIAGHPNTVRNLLGPSGEPLVLKQTLPSEVDFYANKLHASGKLEGEGSRGAQLRKQLGTRWTPKYYGTVDPPAAAADGGESARPYIALTDLLGSGFTRPGVLDVKLGTQLWDERDASEEKRERMEQAAKATTSGDTGMRLTGWRTWDESKGEYRGVGKAFGKGIGQEQLPLGLGAFFGQLRGGDEEDFAESERNAEAKAADKEGKEAPASSPDQSLPPRLGYHLIHPLLSILLPQLDSLISLMAYLEVRIRGGSLLIVYEGDSAQLWKRLSERAIPLPAEEEQQEPAASEQAPALASAPAPAAKPKRPSNPPLFRLRLIDFAHAHFVPGQGPDEGVLKGLRTLRDLISGLIPPKEAVPVSQLLKDEAALARLPAARVLRVEGLVRPMTLDLLREKCREVLADEQGEEEVFDTSILTSGVWLDGIKSSGWLVFRTPELAMRLRDECDGKPFPRQQGPSSSAGDESETGAGGRPPVRLFPVAEPGVEVVVRDFVGLEERAWAQKRERVPLLVRRKVGNKTPDGLDEEEEKADGGQEQFSFLLKLAEATDATASTGKKDNNKKRKAAQDPSSSSTSTGPSKRVDQRAEQGAARRDRPPRPPMGPASEGARQLMDRMGMGMGMGSGGFASSRREPPPPPPRHDRQRPDVWDSRAPPPPLPAADAYYEPDRGYRSRRDDCDDDWDRERDRDRWYDSRRYAEDQRYSSRYGPPPPPPRADDRYRGPLPPRDDYDYDYDRYRERDRDRDSWRSAADDAPSWRSNGSAGRRRSRSPVERWRGGARDSRDDARSWRPAGSPPSVPRQDEGQGRSRSSALPPLPRYDGPDGRYYDRERERERDRERERERERPARRPSPPPSRPPLPAAAPQAPPTGPRADRQPRAPAPAPGHRQDAWRPRPGPGTVLDPYPQQQPPRAPAADRWMDRVRDVERDRAQQQMRRQQQQQGGGRNGGAGGGGGGGGEDRFVPRARFGDRSG